MPEVFSISANLATLVYAVSSMLAVGSAYTLRDIVGPLRDVWAVTRALLANFVVVPVLAWAAVWFLRLDEPLAVGLMLVGTAAGAPFLIRLTTAAGDDVGLSATLLVLLLPITILYMPLVVPVAVPGATVSVGAIALPLVLSMLLPLSLGLLVRAKAERIARRLQPIMAKTSGYALMALVAFTVLANSIGLLDVTMRAILGALLVVGGGFVMGYLLGGRSASRRTVLGLGTAQRNISAAAVVATQGFGEADTLLMVVVTALVGLAILFPIATKLRERSQRRAEPSPESMRATDTGPPRTVGARESMAAPLGFGA